MTISNHDVQPQDQKIETTALALFEHNGDKVMTARELGIDRTTVWRYYQRADFQRIYRQLRREAYLDGVSLLQANSRQAAQTLVDILLDPEVDAKTKRMVANDILNLSKAGLEFSDLSERLTHISHMAEYPSE